jgi:hypothetical protein
VENSSHHCSFASGSFDIAKKNGGVRQISAPIGGVKTLQRNLALLLIECRSEIEGGKPSRKSLSHEPLAKRLVLSGLGALLGPAGRP